MHQLNQRFQKKNLLPSAKGVAAATARLVLLQLKQIHSLQLKRNFLLLLKLLLKQLNNLSKLQNLLTRKLKIENLDLIGILLVKLLKRRPSGSSNKDS